MLKTALLEETDDIISNGQLTGSWNSLSNRYRDKGAKVYDLMFLVQRLLLTENVMIRS